MRRAKKRCSWADTIKPLSRPLLFFLGNEREQVRVDLILMGRGEAVRSARVIDFFRALDEPSRLLRRVLDWNDLVVLSVQNQSRDVKLLEILGEVGLGEGLDALVGVFGPGLHAPEPELI